MENIAKPTNIKFEEGKDKNGGVITIEPCYPGYGTTLGNSLRRVLLSSLSGAAVTGIKIEGATHEFTEIPHVKEDILEIVLNLKKLRMKIDTDEEVKLELKAHGEKQVTAGDITKNSQVEIVDPELVIANITDMSGSLNMEIFAEKGRGYRPVEAEENKEKEKDAGVIDMDAAFSPIQSVGVNVENVRVGKMTNWEKLVLDIVTDGTVTPKEAFEKSVKILVDQFNSLIGEDNSSSEKKKSKTVEKEKGKKPKEKKDDKAGKEKKEGKKETKKETKKKTSEKK
ncbi:MAG: DNA-directed RNA polymerase subunit alpha [Patescibacteria group bacterium]